MEVVNHNKTVILVTGGHGMVGRGLHLALQKYPDEVRPDEEFIFMSSKDADLRLYDATDAYFSKVKPTHVIHFAAKVSGLFGNMGHGLEYFHDNMAMNTNLLRCCHKHGVQKVVSCLSTCIFPDDTPYPLTESMVHQGPPHESLIGYAYSKRMLDIMSRLYYKEYDRKYVSIVPCNIFGPHDNYNLQTSHVFAALTLKVHNAKKNKTPISVWGSGKPERQFIYSVDVGRIALWALRNYDDIEPLNCTGDEDSGVTIKSVAERICKAFNYDGKLELDTSKSDGQLRKPASNAKFMSLNPTFKFTPFDQAVQETVEWFESNAGNIRT